MERRPDAVQGCNKWRTLRGFGGMADGSAGTGRKIDRVGSWKSSQGKKCFSSLICNDSGRGTLF